MEVCIDPKLLQPKTPIIENSWRIWQKKNFSIHRGVIDWTIENEYTSIEDLASRIRTGVREEFRPSWWRGFGFGTVLHFKTVSEDFGQICKHIDTRNKNHGTWQWAILQFDDDKVAVGVHTWLHGFLRPVYDNILGRLEQNGYECSSSDAEMDQLFLTLQKIQKICRPLNLLTERFLNRSKDNH